MRIGATIYRGRRFVLAAWVLAAVLLVWLVPRVSPDRSESPVLLPPDTPYSRAVKAMTEAFPQRSFLSEAIVIFERRGGALGEADLRAIERTARRIERGRQTEAGRDLVAFRVHSPGDFPIPLNPLTGRPLVENPMLSRVSKRGQAGLINVGIEANFVTVRAKRVVEYIHEQLAETDLPEGLDVAVTGSAGYGRDYSEAAESSHAHTMYVTLAAVILILLVVYRAPGAAMIPLAAISLAVVVVTQLLTLGELYGLHAGTAERIFVFVLIYGAGVDYSLLLISRYREHLRRLHPPREAAIGALDASFGAIFASASTDAAGLFMLVFADFGIFRTTGPAVALALVLAMLASLTLVPALVGLIGPRQFWPTRPHTRRREQRLWPRIARAVTARPALTLGVTLGVLAAPAVRGSNLTWVYNTLAGFPPNPEAKVGNAAVGVDIARRHWPVGEIAPTTVLVRSDRPLSPNRWKAFFHRLTPRVADVAGVGEVRSLTQPLGSRTGNWSNLALRGLAAERIFRYYVSSDRRAARMVVALQDRPLSLEAIHTIERLGPVVARAVSEGDLRADLHYIGATPEIMDVRSVTQRDFRRVAVLTLAVIFLIVLALLRDPILSAFMIASTPLTYFATLGISYWVLSGLAGMAGLDWKVEIFLFVVMVAVGVDYNIFLSARLAQEARALPPRRAVEQAVTHTGPVISSCGLIMAATLGSLMAGHLTLLKQLGFALALGMLMDTFVVRPLLLPAFAALTRRKGKAAAFVREKA